MIYSATLVNGEIYRLMNQCFRNGVPVLVSEDIKKVLPSDKFKFEKQEESKKQEPKETKKTRKESKEERDDPVFSSEIIDN